MAEKEITLEVTDEALTYIADKSFDPHYGARPIKRFMQTHILNKVALYMLEKKFQKGGIAYVYLDKKGEIDVEPKRPPKVPSNVAPRSTIVKK